MISSGWLEMEMNQDLEVGSVLATTDAQSPAFRFAVILGQDRIEVDPTAAAATDAGAWFHLLYHVAKLQRSSGTTKALE